MARPRSPVAFEPIEAALYAAGLDVVVGLDEVGRGCLAGPVVAAAVVLPPGCVIEGLDDSKRLSPEQREAVAARVRDVARAVCVAEASVAEIEAINILRASLLAMERAVGGLGLRAQHLLVDGNQPLPMPLPQTPLVKGDGRCASIAAASVVAKVYRDALMARLAERWPGYGFEGHKGYGTEEHRQALERLGPCPEHRRLFRGVAEYLPTGASAVQLGLPGLRVGRS